MYNFIIWLLEKIGDCLMGIAFCPPSSSEFKAPQPLKSFQEE